MDAFRAWTRAGDDEAYEREHARLIETPVLLLDDLGARRQTDFATDVIDDLVRARHSRDLPVIVTSNRNLSQLVAPESQGGLGRNPAIASRLRGLSVHLDGPDYRARGRLEPP